MSSALKLYLSEQRGRARRLAEELDVSESYLSNLSRGRKSGSVEIWRKISEATGIPVAALVGTDETGGFSDDAEPFTPPPVPQGATLDAYLAPGVAHRLTWRSTIAAPSFGILAGDLLVIDMRRAARTGEIVLAATLNGDTTDTRIARLAPPWLITPDPTEPPIDASNARIQGPVIAVARGAGLDAA